MCVCEDEQNGVHSDLFKALSSATATAFKPFNGEVIKNELNFDVDDYVEQQIDKTICIGDEVLWTNYPGQEIQDTNNKEQETDN